MDASSAAANNAAWCDLVCRTSGLPTRTTDGLWSTPTRSPVAYPDAVALRPGLSADSVLAAIDDSEGASVKDSFADLDLARHRYAALFDAEWLVRRPTPPVTPALPWRAVDAATFPRWLAAHGSTSIRAGVLDDPGVRLVLAADRGGPVAVAALNRSGAGPRTVVGVSNVRVRRGDPAVVWEDLPAVARQQLGAHPLVGYESGADLAVAVAAGFEPVGPLRVWVRDHPRS
ncbi:hypothetical protein [uncultured Cellulomonas sp.]|uniref:hypothetical protein n=1 Tax=uncultured Cellulomonas sp. TaxID=189682 RepID=UPI0028E5CB42|nr:hypothetical protein [uncultured Cellulomonas sp.]